MTTFINPSELALFESLLELEFESVIYDLHNSYACERISYSDANLILFFRGNDNNATICIILLNCDIAQSNIDFTNSTQLTLDSFYRGRYLLNGNLYDLGDDDKAYLYISFVDDSSIECFCKTIQVELVT